MNYAYIENLLKIDKNTKTKAWYHGMKTYQLSMNDWHDKVIYKICASHIKDILESQTRGKLKNVLCIFAKKKEGKLLDGLKKVAANILYQFCLISWILKRAKMSQKPLEIKGQSCLTTWPKIVNNSPCRKMCGETFLFHWQYWRNHKKETTRNLSCPNITFKDSFIFL